MRLFRSSETPNPCKPGKGGWQKNNNPQQNKHEDPADIFAQEEGKDVETPLRRGCGRGIVLNVREGGQKTVLVHTTGARTHACSVFASPAIKNGAIKSVSQVVFCLVLLTLFFFSNQVGGRPRSAAAGARHNRVRDRRGPGDEARPPVRGYGGDPTSLRGGDQPASLGRCVPGLTS